MIATMFNFFDYIPIFYKIHLLYMFKDAVDNFVVNFNVTYNYNLILKCRPNKFQLL